MRTDTGDLHTGKTWLERGNKLHHRAEEAGSVAVTVARTTASGYSQEARTAWPRQCTENSIGVPGRSSTVAEAATGYHWYCGTLQFSPWTSLGILHNDDGREPQGARVTIQVSSRMECESLSHHPSMPLSTPLWGDMDDTLSVPE